MQRSRDISTRRPREGQLVAHSARERVAGGVARGQVTGILECDTKGPRLQPGASGTHERALRRMGLRLVRSRMITLTAVRRTDWRRGRKMDSEANGSPR